MENCYQAYWEKKANDWENLCLRCGGCCGAYDDPCEHLKRDCEGNFYCEIYTYRFGKHRTLKGEEFNCVPIENILHLRWSKDYLCNYKRYINTYHLWRI